MSLMKNNMVVIRNTDFVSIFDGNKYII